MSFARPFEEARSILGRIQIEKTDGTDGMSSSPIRDGADSPGTAYEPPVAEMIPRRTKIHTRTSSLQRNYASTGSHTGKGVSGDEGGRKRAARPKL